MKHTTFNSGTPALRLTDQISFRSQRSRNGNVGLKDATALRLTPTAKILGRGLEAYVNCAQRIHRGH